MAKSTRGNLNRWKVAGLILFAFSGFSAILFLFPYFSSVAVAFGVILTLAALAGALLLDEDQIWWKAFIYYNSWLLIVLGISIRAWGVLIRPIAIWLFGMPALFLLAWFMPWIAPEISRKIYSSQMAPKSRGGGLLFSLLLASTPSLAGTFALVGYYGTSRLSQNSNALIIGVLSSFVAIGGCQAISQQMYKTRPWADENKGV